MVTTCWQATPCRRLGQTLLSPACCTRHSAPHAPQQGPLAAAVPDLAQPQPEPLAASPAAGVTAQQNLALEAGLAVRSISALCCCMPPAAALPRPTRTRTFLPTSDAFVMTSTSVCPSRHAVGSPERAATLAEGRPCAAFLRSPAACVSRALCMHALQALQEGRNAALTGAPTGEAAAAGAPASAGQMDDDAVTARARAEAAAPAQPTISSAQLNQAGRRMLA